MPNAIIEMGNAWSLPVQAHTLKWAISLAKRMSPALRRVSTWTCGGASLLQYTVGCSGRSLRQRQLFITLYSSRCAGGQQHLVPDDLSFFYDFFYSSHFQALQSFSWGALCFAFFFYFEKGTWRNTMFSRTWSGLFLTRVLFSLFRCSLYMNIEEKEPFCLCRSV